MAFFFLKIFEVRVPAVTEFLDGAHVNIAVAEPFRNFGHVLVQKAPVLRDGISAEEVLAFFGKRLDESECFEFGVLESV